MDIKIVGSVTDENTLDEIESIMNIFAYEQRIKNYTSSLHEPRLTKNLNLLDKKIKQTNKSIPNSQPHILVKRLY